MTLATLTMRRFEARFLASRGPGTELPCRFVDRDRQKRAKVRLKMSSQIQTKSVGAIGFGEVNSRRPGRLRELAALCIYEANTGKFLVSS